METFEFKVPGLFKGVTAEEAAKELQRIKDQRGILTPEVVVQESENEDSVLHGCFEWDDTKAARAFREHQARKLIGNIRVIITNEKIECKVRAFVHVKSNDLPERSYIPMTEAILDKTAYDDLMVQAKADMESFVSKYAQIEELNPVKAEMLKVLI